MNAENGLDLLENIYTLIRDNPGQFIAAIPMLFPVLLLGPLNALLGFTMIGPAAGGIAAAIQVPVGNPLVFRLLQGAAMGGRAAIVVNRFIRVVFGSTLLLGFIRGVMEIFRAEREVHG